MKEIFDDLIFLIMQKLEEIGISENVLADRCGISRSTLDNLMNRRLGDIKLSTVKKICDELGIHIVFAPESIKKELNVAITVNYNGTKMELKKENIRIL